MHKPIRIKQLSLILPHKTCFADFTTIIHSGQKIAIIGRNGSGKSHLLKMFNRQIEPTTGQIDIPDGITCGYVPQLIEGNDTLSGSQRIHASLSQALSVQPQLLLLDEPTNHLDNKNKRNLLRMLWAYTGTLIIVSHDSELLTMPIDRLWHIENESIITFSGNYNDYLHTRLQKQYTLEKQLIQLKHEKKNLHLKLMHEQERAAKSKSQGKKNIHNKKWPTLVSTAKVGRSNQTAGRNKAKLDKTKQSITMQLDALKLPETIIPTFHFAHGDSQNKIILSISEGKIIQTNGEVLLENINMSVYRQDRIAIMGANGSGKTSLFKAILDQESEITSRLKSTLVKAGTWYRSQLNIGYLDQHYQTLVFNQSAMEIIANTVSGWSNHQIRQHLNTFFLRKNEEVHLPASQLSGGEKVRLCLAVIAAKTPCLLLLDEVTNNLDREMRQYLIDVIKAYPGALLVISHDEDFLKQIDINEVYQITDKNLNRIILST